MTKDPGDYGLSCDQFLRRVALFVVLAVALVFLSASSCDGSDKKWCYDDHGRRVACPEEQNPQNRPWQ